MLDKGAEYAVPAVEVVLPKFRGAVAVSLPTRVNETIRGAVIVAFEGDGHLSGFRGFIIWMPGQRDLP